MFVHIDWCSCKTPNYGDLGCDCPEVDVFHRLTSGGMSIDDANRVIFKSEENKKTVEVIKRTDKSIQI